VSVDSKIRYPEGLVSIDGAAAWLNVPASWVRDKVSARAIPYTKVGRHARFSADDLREIVESGAVPVVARD
jgi:excisionase family DNA binding protein